MRELRLSRIREMSADEVKVKIKDLREELFNLSFRNSMRQLDNPLRIRETRRDLARLMTVLEEHQRGIRSLGEAAGGARAAGTAAGGGPARAEGAAKAASQPKAAPKAKAAAKAKAAPKSDAAPKAKAASKPKTAPKPKAAGAARAVKAKAGKAKATSRAK
jgi:large subunit ribosomal protein L29